MSPEHQKQFHKTNLPSGRPSRPSLLAEVNQSLNYNASPKQLTEEE